MDFMAGTPQGDHRNWEAVRGWGGRVGERFRERLEGGGAPRTDGTDAPRT
jgi:hypothetical protein